MSTGSIPFCNQCRHYIVGEKKCLNLMSIVDGSFAPASFARGNATAGDFTTYAVVDSSPSAIARGIQDQMPLQAVICGRFGDWFEG